MLLIALAAETIRRLDENIPQHTHPTTTAHCKVATATRAQMAGLQLTFHTVHKHGVVIGQREVDCA
jgi:hypothetical protein